VDAAIEHGLVERFVLREHGADIEVFEGSPMSGLAHAGGGGMVGCQLQDCLSKQVGAAGRDEEPGFAVDHGFGRSADTGGNDREALRHGFEDGERKAFGERRENQHRGPGKESRNVADLAQEAHLLMNAERSGERDQLCVSGAFARNFKAESGVPARDDGNSAEKSFAVFFGRKPTNEDCWAPLRGAGARESRDINTVPDSANDITSDAISHAQLESIFGDADEAIGAAAGETDEPILAGGTALALTVAGVDEAGS
jgi:hypothetical protein